MLVGICGKRGVGKTVSAEYLVKKYGFIKLSFADDLRLMAKTLIPFSDLDLTSIGKKEKKFKSYDWTPREFLINLGEFMRYHDKSYWVNRAMARCISKQKYYVFDDVRYQNEAEAIKIANGKLIRIERYEKNNPYGKNLDIPSETDLDTYKFDFEIPQMRNTTLEELHTQLDVFAEEL